MILAAAGREELRVSNPQLWQTRFALIDALSCNNMQAVHSMMQDASPPTVIPQMLWDLLVMECPDWTSVSWKSKLCSFINLGISPSTAKVYYAGKKAYLKFRARFNFTPILSQEEVLILFVLNFLKHWYRTQWGHTDTLLGGYPLGIYFTTGSIALLPCKATRHPWPTTTWSQMVRDGNVLVPTHNPRVHQFSNGTLGFFPAYIHLYPLLLTAHKTGNLLIMYYVDNNVAVPFHFHPLFHLLSDNCISKTNS